MGHGIPLSGVATRSVPFLISNWPCSGGTGPEQGDLLSVRDDVARDTLRKLFSLGARVGAHEQ